MNAALLFTGQTPLVKLVRPRGIWDPMQYLRTGLYPVYAPPELNITWRGKLSTAVLSDLTRKHKTKSLRNLAREYKVSHEAVRRVLKGADRVIE